MKTRVFSTILTLALLVFGARAAHAQETLKLATLAPEGSAWMKLFHEWGRGLEEHTGGKLKVKFYAGGVQGDERDAVRKMRLQQLNAAAVTSIGLGLIQSELRVLELPMLVRTYDELDYLRTKLDDELRQRFLEKDYVLLSWADVGPVHVFTNVPIKARADLAQTKMWAWVDDPLIKEMFKQLGINGVPLGVPDVLPSLQTGLINACYGSPLSTLALQWYTKVKYMTSMNLTMAIGATVVTKQFFDKLAPDVQKVLIEDSKALQTKLLKQIRDDNTKALTTMKQAGLQVSDSPKELVDDFQKNAEAIRARPGLESKVYSNAFRTKVEKLLADYRAGKK
jgi:TRAP-type C4-dicarboxylate transport system substrate-binding protein